MLIMVMCVYGDIIQYKLYNLLVDTKLFMTYIDNILVLIKDYFQKQIDQVRFIFSKLRTYGMKYNKMYFSLGIKYIPFLGYGITWYGIKPDTNKLH